MSTPVVERVDDWNERPFSGGYRELHDLAESGFSGVVRAGGAELYMTRGTVVGVRRGSIEDFEDASGTIYDAPTDALPLLAVMQEQSDEVRAKYYSEDTGISEVDRTLEDGGFTGYVELSENVLSGDYYLVYHQGHSMSVAFVGNAEQLLTEDEAFQRADDEVGIYEVRPVDIEPVEIPEPTEPEEAVPGGVPEDEPDDTEPNDTEPAADTAATASAAEAVVDAEGEAASDDEPIDETQTTVADDTSTTADQEHTGEASSASNGQTAAASMETPKTNEHSDDEAVSGQPESEEESKPRSESEPASVTDQSTDAEPQSDQRESASDTEPPRTESETTASRTEESRVETPTVDETADATPTQTERERSPEQAASTSTEQTPSDPVRESEIQEETPPTPEPDRQRQQTESAVEETPTSDGPSQLETRSVPSLDPERTVSRGRSSSPRRDAPNRSGESQTGGGKAAAQSTGQRSQSTSSAEQATSTTEQSADSSEQSRSQQSQSAASQQSATESPDATSDTEKQRPATDELEAEAGSDASERLDELQELLSERETEIRKLETELEDTAAERDSVRRELEQVREERDELEEQVEKLESELQRLEEELGAATNAQQRMTPQEALSGTDIFVRYRSKGDATLEKAHDGGARKQDVSDNLRLENHTQFDADISAVGGREYDEFIEDTVAYKFVRWVVEDLLFEIQSTGHTESLSELYDALPKINRVELNGAVNVTYSEDGQETETTETFDVVFRERMGDPLLVANINDSRQGATESMMEGLITAAERVGQTSDQFASAFLVTESFFEPEALETVAEATRGGILSRDKRKSFVNLSRKRGYHLCLVEARNQNFHLEVPEL